MAAAAAGNVTSFVELLSSAANNPTMLTAMVIQFVLGFAAGYYMAKIAKYVVALIGVFIIGALIGAWGVSGSVEDTLKSLTQNWLEAKDVAMKMLQFVSTILVGPTALGFFVGLVIGATRK